MNLEEAILQAIRWDDEKTKKAVHQILQAVDGMAGDEALYILEATKHALENQIRHYNVKISCECPEYPTIYP